ncbi:aldehyde dehydrogenase family protein [Phaeobacter inhibens]|uniref:aldehyde dehydrogenase family protein n=1 Tax=Phaeobacter inhibens TaxID=221822 RepID=UPI0021A2DF5C|nr:aldehyde dehydrogenase family protein [Phaeobacter inhibens]UWR62709.1 aldehyde dehydrogenase family protein [Phaeobacter inhibens]UWS06155.1 aldehyde dehydrogenase family protein [Phaeobacter inhibens]
MSADGLIAAYFDTGALPDLPRDHFIDGRAVAPGAGGRMESFDPGRGTAFADFAAGDAADVDHAVTSAVAGFEIWSATPPARRCAILNEAARLMRHEAEHLAVVECVDSGKTLAEARGDIAGSARLLEYYAGAADKLDGRSVNLGNDNAAFTLREPVGVTAHIVPWNYPTSTLVRGIAPALAAGCSAVVKPAETTPFTALMIADLLIRAGLPAGVVNVVTGTGIAAGAPLVRDPRVRHVTFTGSVATGVGVMQSVAPNVTGLTLELGGKSPLVAFGDANVDAVVEGALWAIFSNAGQICSAGSRLVIHRSLHAEVRDKLVARAQRLRVGHGLRGPDIGAVNSARHLAQIDDHVSRARTRGVEIVTGGEILSDVESGKGWFYAPTILDDLAANDDAVLQEIFGPVLAIQVFEDEAEALALANGTEFALAAGIYTRDIATALRMARRVDAGQVTVNDYWAGGIELPFGGNRKSGFGREKGLEGLDAYTRSKAVTLAV